MVSLQGHDAVFGALKSLVWAPSRQPLLLLHPSPQQCRGFAILAVDETQRSARGTMLSEFSWLPVPKLQALTWR